MVAMKKGIVLSLLSLVTFIVSAYSQDASTIPDKRHRLGVRISSKDAVVNHSVTYQYFFNQSLAIEGLLTFTDPAALGFLVEKHYHFRHTGAAWYWGAGLYAGFGSSRRFGMQGVTGLDFKFPLVPINLSLDWKPELNFTKEFSFEPAAVGLSVRFVF